MRLGEFEGFPVCEKRIRLISTQQKQKLKVFFFDHFPFILSLQFIPTRLEFLFPFSHVDATMSGMILTGPSASFWGDFSCCLRLYCQFARRRVSMRLKRPGSSHEIHLHWNHIHVNFILTSQKIIKYSQVIIELVPLSIFRMFARRNIMSSMS